MRVPPRGRVSDLLPIDGLPSLIFDEATHAPVHVTRRRTPLSSSAPIVEGSDRILIEPVAAGAGGGGGGGGATGGGATGGGGGAAEPSGCPATGVLVGGTEETGALPAICGLASSTTQTAEVT